MRTYLITAELGRKRESQKVRCENPKKALRIAQAAISERNFAVAFDGTYSVTVS